MSADPEIIRKSVTKDDYPEYRGGSVFHFMIPTWAPHAAVYALPPDPPPYWTRYRDYTLRATPYLETSFWAGAISIAISKMSSMAWEVRGEYTERVKRVQNLLLRSDGPAGWVQFLSKHLRDFLTVDSGSYVEIIRAKRAYGSRIIGIKHLDACRCTRTGDPEIPVVYRDRHGHEHMLRYHQVMMFADMPDPSDLYYGIGHCAAGRCYREIYKMAAIQRYVAEKVAGSRPLAIHLVTGISERSLETAMITASQQQAQKGAATYMGAVVVPMLGDVPATLVTIPLAELPDGFDADLERQYALQSYANAIGLDIQSLHPLTGKMAGTATQSKVLDDKEEGKGLSAWRQQFMHNVNEWITPNTTVFYFRERDYRDQQSRADITTARMNAMGIAITNGIVTAGQALQVLVDLDELPKEFLAYDQTPGNSLSDSDKPVDEKLLAQTQATVQQQQMAEVQAQQQLAAGTQPDGSITQTGAATSNQTAQTGEQPTPESSTPSAQMTQDMDTSRTGQVVEQPEPKSEPKPELKPAAKPKTESGEEPRDKPKPKTQESKAEPKVEQPKQAIAQITVRKVTPEQITKLALDTLKPD